MRVTALVIFVRVCFFVWLTFFAGAIRRPRRSVFCVRKAELVEMLDQNWITCHQLAQHFLVSELDSRAASDLHVLFVLLFAPAEFRVRLQFCDVCCVDFRRGGFLRRLSLQRLARQLRLEIDLRLYLLRVETVFLCNREVRVDYCSIHWHVTWKCHLRIAS